MDIGLRSVEENVMRIVGIQTAKKLSALWRSDSIA
jgi:hypothetical protein